MRITVTVESMAGTTDTIIDCDDSATVSELTTSLAASVGSASGALYLGASPVDPELTVAEVGLLDGARVGLGFAPHLPPQIETAGWQLRVVSGPDAGAVFALPVGTHDLGRSGELSFNDTSLSRRHCRLSIQPDGATVADLGSSNGTVLAGERLEPDQEHPLELGQPLAIGHSLVVLETAVASDAVIVPAEPGVAHYLRQPRMLPPQRSLSVNIPTAPPERPRRRFPLIAMIVPLVFGVVMAAVMKNPLYLMFTVMSPVMLLANYIGDQRSGAKDHQEALRKYHDEVEAAQTKLAELTSDEELRLREEFPDPADLFLVTTLPTHRLWERRRGDHDDLAVRFGTGTLPSTITLTGDSKDQEPLPLTEVPITVRLREDPVVGVAGPLEGATALMRWLLAQLCILHPTRDLEVTLLTTSASTHWQWTAWLPHFGPDTPDGPIARIANDSETLTMEIAGLIALVDGRQRALKDNRGAAAESFPAHVVVIDGYENVRTALGMKRILEEGPAVGVYILCSDTDARRLPEQCTATLIWNTDVPDFAALRRSGRETIENVRVEGVTVAWADRTARALCPLIDVGDQEDSTLPNAARLVEVLDMDPPDPAAIRARWALEPRSTAMTIGVGLEGNFTLDLHRDGPHGLIAGTTGSGKTELLQTMIASLALVNRPDELNFVLVDYKGDSAFKDCVNLPHTVGKVNDLDTHLVKRALESLAAELRFREHFLAEAAVKDIEDYQLLRAREPHRQPLPRLVLVIDEFASLVKELPDFVTGLVSIAQRGRSLGIHLLLATQRPSGAVSADIRANTNLRVSLRVTDSGDSNDVLQSPDAALIAKSQPGRAYARLGAGALLPFQSGRVGGRRPGLATVEVAQPFVAPISWQHLGRTAPQPTAEKKEQTDVADTDLAAIVAAVREASAAEAIAGQRQPWLDPLEDRIVMPGLDLPRVKLGEVPPLVYGVVDNPATQSQSTASFDPARDGHLIIMGSARSGRSQVLRAIAASIAVSTSPQDLHVYGLDCGSGALNPMSSLPHCGAIVSRVESDRAVRLLRRLDDVVSSRQATLAQAGYADISEQRRSGDTALPHLVVMLDNWEGFLTTVAELEGGEPLDIIMRLLREGASLGVHLLITGDRQLSSPRVSSLTDSKLVLRFADKADFSAINMSARQVPDHLPPGRGFRSDHCELQVYLIDADDSGKAQAQQLISLAAASRAVAGTMPPDTRPFRLDALPSRIEFDEALQYVDPTTPTPHAFVGVGGDDLTCIGPDFSAARAFIVAGPGRSGRSTALRTLARSWLRSGGQAILVAPRPSPLRDLADEPGVLGLITAVDEPVETYSELAQKESAPLLVIMDDAEELKEAKAADFYLTVLRGMQSHVVALVIGGRADGLSSGFSGWHKEANKARQGLLLSPQDFSDGQLVGANVPRSALSSAVIPGRGIIHLGDGYFTRIAVAIG